MNFVNIDVMKAVLYFRRKLIYACDFNISGLTYVQYSK